MSDPISIKLEVDTTKAVEGIDRVSDALARLRKELGALEGLEHGGISLKIAGAIAILDVKPK